MEIKPKKIVKLNYKGTFDDGSEFDSSEGREPLEFMFGQGMIIPGLEKELEGLKAGDTKQVKVSSDEAYGDPDPNKVEEVPKEQFPEDIELKEGLQLAAEGPQGAIPVTVVEVGETSAKVDFNHPLAGKDLNFDIEIVEVREPTEEELAEEENRSMDSLEEELEAMGDMDSSQEEFDEESNK